MPKPEGITPPALVLDESELRQKRANRCVNGFKKMDIAPVWNKFIGHWKGVDALSHHFADRSKFLTRRSFRESFLWRVIDKPIADSHAFERLGLSVTQLAKSTCDAETDMFS